MPGTDDHSEGIRINRYISSSGICSRREADRMIADGKVEINGQTADIGSRVYPGDEVKVDGRTVVPEDNKIYIALNKPLGITCTTDPSDPDNIIDYLGLPDRVFTIGRLDKNSSGLILLTNDGDIVNRLLRAENGHEKEYRVRVDRPISNDFKQKMEGGLPILGQTTLPCKVTVTAQRSFTIVLHQGLNRQIRRMCEYLGYKVVKLTRVRFMNIELGDMKPGEYRYLNNKEKSVLLKLADNKQDK